MLRGSNAWDLKSVVIVAINMQNQYHRAFTAQMLYATHDYIDSSGRIFEDTCQIFENRDNYTIREKYMNLWVALESLARTSMYSNIISCRYGTDIKTENGQGNDYGV